MKIHLDLAPRGRALIIIGATVGLLILPALTAAVIPAHWQAIGTSTLDDDEDYVYGKTSVRERSLTLPGPLLWLRRSRLLGRRRSP